MFAPLKESLTTSAFLILKIPIGFGGAGRQ